LQTRDRKGVQTSSDAALKLIAATSRDVSSAHSKNKLRFRRQSTCEIDIDEFVPKSSIDPQCLIRLYNPVPDGKVGHDAFAVIRETIRIMDMVAIGRVVLSNREHIIAQAPSTGSHGDALEVPVRSSRRE
jgi:non-homologous end joining protein Ku